MTEPINALTLPRSGGLGLSLTERLVARRLESLEGGLLQIEHRGRTRNFGRPAPDGLSATINVLDPSVFSRVLLGGTIGASEAFMDGGWEADDLVKALRLFVRDADLLARFELGASRAGLLLARLFHALRRNTRSGSRKNIAHHYDLGNDFFELMLDPTMTYSAAVFEHGGSTLEEASTKKIDMLCRRLALSPGDHLLEIGTGWGSLAIHAATHFGCKVTTTTISAQQRALAIERIRAQGLEGLVTVLDRDYRDLTGRYDKIVSCEMIEAVGHQYHPDFFGKCASLLVPGGKLALQSITIRDRIFERASREVDFIKRYIFPGSCIPSATALLTAATEASDLVLRGFEDITPHYARTMAEWRARLQPHKSAVVERYGERFWRMWSYYLAYCEAGFEERCIGCAQMMFEKAS